MFIRKKTKKHNGQVYVQHQLLKSIRTSFGPRHEVILNLGTLDIAEEKWKSLADAIERKLNNQEEFFFIEPDEEIERLAQHYAQMIICKEMNEERKKSEGEKVEWEIEKEGGNGEEEVKEPEYERVDVNSVKTTESRSIGGEYLILDQMKRYGFDGILEGIEMTEKEKDYAKMLIVGRAVHPSSERELARWVNENSGIRELMGSEVKVYDMALHRVAVKLWENREEIEKNLSEKARDLFSLDEKIILYDLTNTYFEGKKKGSHVAQFAISKEKRNDCKVVTLALVVDSEGFPKESKILEGNISEPKTFASILEEVEKMGEGRKEEKTIVMDAGIATEKNIELIKNKENFKYVVISRKEYDVSIWEGIEEKKVLLNDEKTELRLKLVKQEDQKEAYLLCHSPRKEIKEKEMIERRMKKFEEALKEIQEGLKKPKTQKRYDKIMERIGRLKERYHVGTFFDIEVKQENHLVQEIIFKINLKGEAQFEKVGEYVIRTNRLDLHEEEISKIHRTLSMIEDAFETMKSELGLRPNYHKQEEPTMAHISITVQAYHMVCAILKRLSYAGIRYTWNTIRNILSSHDRVITTFNTEDHHRITIANTVQPNLRQKEIYDKLGLKQDPLKNVKLKIPILITSQNM
jgi:hypothetical protein